MVAVKGVGFSYTFSQPKKALRVGKLRIEAIAPRAYPESRLKELHRLSFGGIPHRFKTGLGLTKGAYEPVA
jgi:hypothetical protein